MSVSSLLIPPPFDSERDDWGATLLAQWGESQVAAGTRVLIVGAGAGAVGLPLVRAGATLTFADDSVAALAAAQLTFTQARQSATFVTTRDLAPEQPFDLALLNIVWWPDARRGAELIALAAEHVRPGGIIAVGGGKSAGMGGAERDLTALVGANSVVVYKKGHRVIAAVRPAAWSAPVREPDFSSITVRGETLTVEHSAGVFADGGLDPATTMLLEALTVAEGAHVLDLGCGAGIIGMVIKRLAPSATLTLVDSNVVAVALTERNLARNGIDGRALASNDVAALANEAFDLVVSNPPFHVGRARTDYIGRRFISEAHTVLRPGGSLVLVANRFLRYEPDMQAAFGNVRELAGNDSYKVLAADRT